MQIKNLSSDVAKAGTNFGIAITTHDPSQIIGTAIAETVGLAASIFQQLSEERTKSLFDDPLKYQRIVNEIKKSENFASAVYDIWIRYNLESNSHRRLALKNFLEKTMAEDGRSYENFTKLLNTIQTITFAELSMLDAFYEPGAYMFCEIGTPTAADYMLNVSNISELLGEEKYNEQKLELLSGQLNQLGHLGLIYVKYNSTGGPYYKPNSFGKLFLSYIKTDA